MFKISGCKYFLFLSLFVLVGCASSNPYLLVYESKNISGESINPITVLPVVDARQQIYQNVSFEKRTKHVNEILVKYLEKKGYDCHLAEGSNSLGPVHPFQIAFLDAQGIRQIGPAGAERVFVPVVVELTPDITEMVYYLFDKRKGKLIWEGSSMYKKLQKGTKIILKDFPNNK